MLKTERFHSAKRHFEDCLFARIEDAFGPDFRTRMIGQVVELEGEFQRYYCKGWKGSIRISLAHQIRKVAGLDPVEVKGQAKQ